MRLFHFISFHYLLTFDGTLQKLVGECKVGAKVFDLCLLGDNELEAAIKGVYTKAKEMEKGIAFPTCVSVNEIVGHYSPIAGDENLALAEGDVVKM
jgi:methionine aminopeptidase